MKFNVWFFVLLLLIGSIIFSCYSAPAEMIGDTPVDTEVMYRKDLFGPYYTKTTFENGVSQYALEYPWYYFCPNTLNLVSIATNGGLKQGHMATYTTKTPGGSVYLKFYLQNSLASKKDCKKVDLIFYEGTASDLTGTPTGRKLNTYSLEGSWKYAETFVMAIDFGLPKKTGVYHYVVDEYETCSNWPLGSKTYKTGRGWIDIVIESPTAVTGELSVVVYDNMVPRTCFVDLYQGNSVYKSNVKLEGGRGTFKNLPFGTYRVQVLDSGFESYFYDCAPASCMVNDDIGSVMISSIHSSVSYLIFGDQKDTDDDGFDDLNPDDPIDPGEMDGSSGFSDVIKDVAKSFGLFAIVLFGLPLFILLLVVFLVYKWTKKREGSK